MPRDDLKEWSVSFESVRDCSGEMGIDYDFFSAASPEVAKRMCQLKHDGCYVTEVVPFDPRGF